MRSVKAPEIGLDRVPGPPITGIQNKASLKARWGNRSDPRRECLREREGGDHASTVIASLCLTDSEVQAVAVRTCLGWLFILEPYQI